MPPPVSALCYSLLSLIRHLITLPSAEEDLLRQRFVFETVPKGSFFRRPGEVGFVLQGVFHSLQSRDSQKLTY